MREDMFEVIIERPRQGGKMPRERYRRPRELEDMPRCESMARGRGGTKGLNENLAPLVRFFRSRLGRPWNEVHAEISEHLSLRSAVQKHVLDHVRQMVELHAVIIDGRAYHPTTYRHHLLLVTPGRWGGFYVCPESGRLREALPDRRKLPEPAPDRVELEPGYEAWRIEGLWYRVRFAPVPQARVGLRDLLLRRRIDETGVVGPGGALEQKYGWRYRYAAEKRQMSHDEIAALARRLRRASHPQPRDR
jgi:hypothetical protein